MRRRALGILGPAFSAVDRYRLAADEAALGLHDRALVLLDGLIADRPASLRGLRDGLALRRIRCYMALNRLDEAQAHLTALRARKPDHLAPLELHAKLLGGTVVADGETFIERRHLRRLGDAFEIWKRIKEYAERKGDYNALWFRTQFHIALLNYWNGSHGRVHGVLHWIEVSGYSLVEGNPYAREFRWLAGKVGYAIEGVKRGANAETARREE